MSACSRRRMLGLGIALAALPAASARAATNDALRKQLHYRDTPNGEESCANCVDFLPGPREDGPGGCKRIPGDDRILPTGYCDVWNTM